MQTVSLHMLALRLLQQMGEVPCAEQEDTSVPFWKLGACAVLHRPLVRDPGPTAEPAT